MHISCLKFGVASTLTKYVEKSPSHDLDFQFTVGNDLSNHERNKHTLSVDIRMCYVISLRNRDESQFFSSAIRVSKVFVISNKGQYSLRHLQ